MSDLTKNLRKKLLYRSKNRGCRETDILLGEFAMAQISQLSVQELEVYEHFLNEYDGDIYKWLTRASVMPEAYKNNIGQRFAGVLRKAMNKELIARNFGRRAANYENEARLQVMVAQELISQCREFKGSVLDLGAGPGIIAKRSEWDVTSLDISLEMCNLAPGKAVNADAENIPFSPQSFANVVSSLSLQWLINLENVLGEVNRILKPGGKFSFTTFAPSSLKDLRAAFSYIDANQHIMEFERAIKLFAMLKKAGFSNLVMSSQKISFHYDNMLSALRSIKNIGAGYNFSAHKNLHGKGYFTRLENVYKGLVKAQDQVPLHWEVLYIHAEKPM